MDEIIFLGTGGARKVMSTQALSTGGFILKMKDTTLSVDPGPGAIVKAARENIDVGALDGILVSHRHLDHCGDVNVMIEAMSSGGYRKKGVVFAPKQAIFQDPVILKYLWNYVEDVHAIEERGRYRCKTLDFETSVAHEHGEAETYGFIFHGKDYKLGYLPDTRYFEGLGDSYDCDICIFSTLLLDRGHVYHLSVPDVVKLIGEIKPGTAILTHFGMQVLRMGVENVAHRIQKETGVYTIAAKDGLRLNIRELL